MRLPPSWWDIWSIFLFFLQSCHAGRYLDGAHTTREVSCTREGLVYSRGHGSHIACVHHAVKSSGVQGWIATSSSTFGALQGPLPLLLVMSSRIIFEAAPIVFVRSTPQLRLTWLLGGISAMGLSHHLASDNDKATSGGEERIKGMMIAFVKAYKKELSPLIPPACRFLPTCSVYAVEAIEKFGPAKGGVLTAWRLMRCNPFGGYGIDHPRWPPPGWFAGEKW